jgi:hypothetical protein
MFGFIKRYGGSEVGSQIASGKVQRTAVIGAVLAACIATIHGVPPWLLARPGAVVFTSAGEEDSPTTPICATVAAYRAYVTENGAKGCVEHPMGLKVVIDSIIPATAKFGAIAMVHEQNKAFHGYTAVTELLPAIPHGVAVTLEPGAGETLTLSTDQRADVGVGSDLGVRAAATTLRFDPANADKRDLSVRVTSGKYRGRKGWVFARQAFFEGKPLDTLVF